MAWSDLAREWRRRFVRHRVVLAGIGAALLASWLPARRAAPVDPMKALREE